MEGTLGAAWGIVELSALWDVTEFRVAEIVKVGRLLAGKGLMWVGAGEGLLVEHGLIGAREGEVRRLQDGSGVVGDGQTDVEELAVIVDVGIVAVSTVVAGEGGLESASLQECFNAVRKNVSHAGGSDGGEGQQDDEDNTGHDAGGRRGTLREVISQMVCHTLPLAATTLVQVP